MADAPCAPTRARKIASLHRTVQGMAAEYDTVLHGLFDIPDVAGVADEIVLAGQDGEVIRLRIVADRLTGAEAAAALARAGRASG